MFSQMPGPELFVLTPLAVGHFCAAIALMIVASLVARWERRSKISYQYLTLSTLFILYVTGRGLVLSLQDPELQLLVSRGFYIVMPLCVPLVLRFMYMFMNMLSQRRMLIATSWTLALITVLASVIPNAVVNGLHTFSWGREPALGPMGYVILSWVSVLVLITGSDIWRALRNSLPGSIERKRLQLLGLAMFSLYIVLTDLLNGLGIPVYPMGFLMTFAFISLVGYVTWRYGLVEMNTGLAAREIAELAGGALIILDQDGVVRFINAQTLATLGLTQADVIGKQAESLFGAPFTAANLMRHAQQAGGMQAGHELAYRHAKTGQRLDLMFSVLPVTDQHGRYNAFVCLLRDITDQKKAQQLRLTEGLKDVLTGLPNRVSFIEQVESAIRQIDQQPEFVFTICSLGIDRLHVINQDLGYAAGDHALIQTAGRLQCVLRSHDVVARVGQDEFGLLIKGIADEQEVRKLLWRVGELLRQPLTYGDHDLYLTCSIGAASSRLQYKSGVDLLRYAGAGMYRARAQAHGPCTVHYVASEETAGQRTRLEAELRAALDRGQLRVHYQPVVDLIDRRVVGYEALVRWQHPQRGLLLPGAFIEFAEQIGLIAAIDRFVFERACADLKIIHEKTGDHSIRMSVNAAEEGLRDPQFVERVRATLERNALSARCLHIEVLERSTLSNSTREVLRQLRDMGLGLYVDDFGTGYSSFSRLHELPVTGLKIDRDFVRAMSKGQGGEKIIRSILGLAATMGFDTITEGTGTAAEVRSVYQLGCVLVQGYYFSEPLPLDEAINLACGDIGLADRFLVLDLDAEPAIA